MSTNATSHDSLEFCLLLAKANAAMVRRLDRRLGTFHGIGFGDFMVLLQLSRAPQGRLRRVDLAEQLGLTASAVTRTLIPLEKIGLVKRQPDARDARVGYATLTRAGQRVLEESSVTAQLATEDNVASINPAQLVSLSEAMARLGAK